MYYDVSEANRAKKVYCLQDECGVKFIDDEIFTCWYRDTDNIVDGRKSAGELFIDIRRRYTTYKFYINYDRSEEKRSQRGKVKSIRA